MAYRAQILGSEATPDGDVRLVVIIESDRGGDWEQIPHGRVEVVLDGAAVLAITNDDALSANQKRQALAEMFRERVRERGADAADDAAQALDALVDFPVTLNLSP